MRKTASFEKIKKKKVFPFFHLKKETISQLPLIKKNERNKEKCNKSAFK